MALQVTVNDIDRSIYYLSNSFRASWRVGERSTGSIAFRYNIPELGVGTDWRPQHGNQVAVYWDGTRVLTGDIIDRRASRLAWRGSGPTMDLAPMRYDCTLASPERRLEKRVLPVGRFVSDDSTTWTCGSIIAAFENYLNNEGITLGTIEDGPEIEKYLVGLEGPVSIWQIFSELAEKAKKSLFIDAELKLQFVDRTFAPAPYAVNAETAATVFRNIEYRLQYAEKHNRHYRRIAWDSFTPIETPLSGDGSTQSFSLEIAGDAVYPARVESIVLQSGGELIEQRFGVRDVDETDVEWYWSPGESEITQHEDGTPLAAGEVLLVKWRRLGTDVVMVEDDPDQELTRIAEPNTSGIYEMVSEDLSSKATQDDAEADAQAIMDENLAANGEITFQSDLTGWAAGQLVTINLPDFELADDYLLQDLQVSEVDDKLLRADITCIDKARAPGWAQYFRGKLSASSTERKTQEVTDGGIDGAATEVVRFVLGACDPVTGEDAAEYHANVAIGGKPFMACLNSADGTACKLDVKRSADGIVWSSILDGNKISVPASDKSQLQYTNFNEDELVAGDVLRVDVVTGSASKVVLDIRWRRLGGAAGSFAIGDALPMGTA
jgi:hypothetical protein